MVCCLLSALLPAVPSLPQQAAKSGCFSSFGLPSYHVKKLSFKRAPDYFQKKIHHTFLPPSIKPLLVSYLKFYGDKTHSRLWDTWALWWQDLHAPCLFFPEPGWNAGKTSIYIFNLEIQPLHLSKPVVWTTWSFSQMKLGWLRQKQCITSAGAAEELAVHHFGINVSKHSSCHCAGDSVETRERAITWPCYKGSMLLIFPVVFLLRAVWPLPLTFQMLQS